MRFTEDVFVHIHRDEVAVWEVRMQDEGILSCSVAHISGIPGMMESSRLTCMASQTSDSGISIIAGETLQLVCCVLSQTPSKNPLTRSGTANLSCNLGVRGMISHLMLLSVLHCRS